MIHGPSIGMEEYIFCVSHYTIIIIIVITGYSRGILQLSRTAKESKIHCLVSQCNRNTANHISTLLPHSVIKITATPHHRRTYLQISHIWNMKIVLCAHLCCSWNNLIFPFSFAQHWNEIHTHSHQIIYSNAMYIILIGFYSEHIIIFVSVSFPFIQHMYFPVCILKCLVETAIKAQANVCNAIKEVKFKLKRKTTSYKSIKQLTECIGTIYT